MRTDHARVQKDCGPVSKTHQSMAHDADIKTIVNRFRRGAILPEAHHEQLQYGDFSEALDLHQSMIAVQEAQDDFMELPSKVREACGNSPVKFLEMCSNPDNLEQLRELGLAEQQELPGVPTPIVPPTTPPAEPAQGGEDTTEQDSQTPKGS